MFFREVTRPEIIPVYLKTYNELFFQIPKIEATRR